MTWTVVLGLYLVFRLKQLAGDYLLQTKWMALTKGSLSREGWKALATHAGIHAALTFAILLVVAPSLWALALVDFAAHAAVDRLKGRLVNLKGWTPSNWQFWWAFGIDQEVHNLTHLVYLVMIVAAAGGISP